MNDSLSFALMVVGLTTILFLPLSIKCCKDGDANIAKIQLEQRQTELQILKLKAGITNDLESATSPDSD